MIVSHNHKFVYYGLPRCASTSMHHMLQDPKWSGDDSWNSAIHPEAQQHLVIEAPDGYLKWTVVRNPFS